MNWQLQQSQRIHDCNQTSNWIAQAEISHNPGVFGTQRVLEIQCSCGNFFRRTLNPGPMGTQIDMKLVGTRKLESKEPEPSIWETKYQELKEACKGFLDGSLDPKDFVEKVMNE